MTKKKDNGVKKEEPKNSTALDETERATKDDKADRVQDLIEQGEILDDLPPEIKGGIKTVLSMKNFSGSLEHPLTSKINETHIDKIIDMSAKDDERDYKNIQQERIFHLIYFFAAISLFVFLVIFLVDKNTDLFKELVKWIALFAGGWGAGYGYKSYKAKK